MKRITNKKTEHSHFTLVLFFLLFFSIPGIAQEQNNTKNTLHIKKTDTTHCKINLSDFSMENMDTVPGAKFRLYFSTNMFEVLDSNNNVSTWQVFDYLLSVAKPGEGVFSEMNKVDAADSFPVLCSLMNGAEKGTRICFNKIQIINSGRNVILENKVVPLVITRQ